MESYPSSFNDSSWLKKQFCMVRILLGKLQKWGQTASSSQTFGAGPGVLTSNGVCQEGVPCAGASSDSSAMPLWPIIPQVLPLASPNNLLPKFATCVFCVLAKFVHSAAALDISSVLSVRGCKGFWSRARGGEKKCPWWWCQ